ncbi:ATP-dependent metallopeptidase FtsH/Yme1/Tma family protein, partial [Aggregatibacter actinomycetemcomitans]
MVKNLILWVVVAIVMMTAYQSFNTTSGGGITDYTTFISDVENNQVRQAKFEDNEILVTKTDGTKYTTVIPLEDKDLLNDLLKKKVKVEGTPPERRSLLSQILISWFPMLLLIGVWVFFMRQMQG